MIIRLIILSCILCAACNAAVGDALLHQDAVRHQVCVLIGLTDASLLEDLKHVDGIQTFIGLDHEQEQVTAARAAWRSHYGAFSARSTAMDDLPFANDVINTVIIPDFKRVQAAGLSLAEAKRILAPFGSLLIAGVVADGRQVDINGSTWSIMTKALPTDVDVWTHYRYDASSSSVSNDKRVGPVNGIKWIQGKTWAASFGGAHSILSAAGRNFYVRDGEIIKKEDGCQLEVRDAFNGSLLWVAPVYYERMRGWIGPPQVVVTDDYVISIKEKDGPLLIRRTADGSTVSEIESLAGGSFNVNDDLIYYCSADAQHIRRFNLKTMQELEPVKTGKVSPESMILVYDNKLFLSAGSANDELCCFDLESLQQRWRSPNKGKGTLYWVRNNTLLTLQRTETHKGGVDIHGYDAATGAQRWTHQSTTKKGSHPSALFVGDVIWAYQQERWFTGIDPQTGERIQSDRGRAKEFGRCGFHHATEDYILGMDFSVYDMSKANTFDCFIARADCGVGYIPANGLVYQYGNQCRCGSYVTGVLALHSDPVPAYTLQTQAALTKGPAFDSNFDEVTAAGDWTSLRGNQQRSGSTSLESKATWKQRWQIQAGGKSSPALIVNDSCFIADTDAHSIKSFALSDGTERWSFTADARIDSPPTIHKGRALFGSCDGTLYCLNAQSGAVAWTFKAAPAERMIAVRGQFESLWMLNGAVAVDNDIAYIVAGRHGDADGGLFAYGLHIPDGELVWSKHIQGFPPFRTDPHTRLIEARREIPQVFTEEAVKAVNERFLSGIGYSINNDVPIIEEGQLIIGTIAINLETKEINVPSGQSIYTNGLGLLVDNTNPEFTDRNRWIFTGLNEGRSWRTPRAPDIMANLIAYDDDCIVAINHSLSRSRTTGVGRVSAYPNPVSQGKKGMASKLAGLQKAWNKSYRDKNDRLKAVLLSANHIFVAGDRGGLSVDADLSKRVGFVAVHDKQSGQILNYLKLPEAPVFDGLSMNAEVLMVTLMDGSLLCFEHSDTFAADVPKAEQKTYTALRINCGSLLDFTDTAGQAWQADQEFEAGDWGFIDGGIVTRNPRDVSGTEDDDIYLNEHYGMSAYRIPVEDGTYAVRLHFAETWRGNNAAGKRVFDVLIEGETVIRDLDVFKESGDIFAAHVSQHEVEVSDGELSITFGGKGFMINGIELQKK